MISKNIKWTIEKIKEGFDSFYKENGRYPTSQEIDKYPKLPSARQIQRKYGGLPTLRKLINIDGPLDFTKGEHSSKRAILISRRAHQNEKEIYEYLKKKFGEAFVHREYFFNDDRRTRTDFYVFCANGDRFSIDVFYPNSLHNLNGCINSKLQKYRGLIITYPTIFLVMNDLISEEEINKLMGNKKNKLGIYQFVMTLDQLRDFCDTKQPASFIE
jgi:hypothetical protein